MAASYVHSKESCLLIHLLHNLGSFSEKKNVHSFVSSYKFAPKYLYKKCMGMQFCFTDWLTYCRCGPSS